MQKREQKKRYVVWSDHEYPGFRGTAFLVHFFGKCLAVTARHVLTSVDPINFSLPRNLDTGPMDLVYPSDIFWYHAGDYSHIADKAVAVMPNMLRGAMNMAHVAFEGPRSGENVCVRGFPVGESEVRYKLSEGNSKPDAIYRAAGVKSLFVWETKRIRGACIDDGGSLSLGQLSLEVSDVGTLDGMSGSPVAEPRASYVMLALRCAVTWLKRSGC